MGFVREAFAFAGAAAHHLGKEDAGFDWAQEDDVFEIGNVDAGGEHVDGDDDAGRGAIAELADVLQRTVDVVAGDLADERVAAAEDFLGESHELVGVRGVRQVIDGEDESFGKTAVRLLVFESVGFDFFEDLAVGIGRCDFAFDLSGVELAFVFQVV